MLELQYVTVDVFTDRQFSGNQLAVVFLENANTITSEQMLQIAKEFNFGETSFVLPPPDNSCTATLRIFTPEVELEFAGHPTIGSAVAVAQLGHLYGKQVPAQEIIFSEPSGLVRCRLFHDSCCAGECCPCGEDSPCRRKPVFGASLVSPQKFHKVAEPEQLSEVEVAKCLRIAPEDIIEPPVIAGVGLPFLYAKLKSPDVLDQIVANVQEFQNHEHRSKTHFGQIHAYTETERADGIDIEARMFCPLDGPVEDAATGSANCALVGLLHHQNHRLFSESSGITCTKCQAKSWNISILQGVKMGRPSKLYGRATVKTNAQEPSIHIGGSVVTVMKGTLFINV